MSNVSEVRLAVRQLVEFLLRTGDIDSRFTGFDRANEGARIHRRLQKEAGDGYEAEVFLTETRTRQGVAYTVEGRADGIFTAPDGVTVIDEIKTTAVPADEITEDMNPCHWAQGMVYAAIYGGQRSLSRLRVRLTYYQIDEDKILRFEREFSQEELDGFFNGLLDQYAPWAARRLDWAARRRQSLLALRFPFEPYRPGQRALAGEIYRACRAGRETAKGGTRLLCQAPTGTGKTMSAVFPALRAMGEGSGEKVFYLTARGTTRAAAENAVRLLRAANPGLCLRSVTLAAKDKVCLCKNDEDRPECLPERCPYARGYYERLRDALAALLDAAGGDFDRAVLEAAARRFTVCPFELGLDLSEWCDLVVGDYNYLFDPTVHLRRFFDTAGDWLFLIDEAHNLPSRAREMYSSRFAKSSLTGAKKALGKGKGWLKTSLSQADKAMLALRRACEDAGAPDTDAVPSPLLGEDAPLYAKDGTVFLKQIPTGLLRPLEGLLAPLQDWLEDHADSPAHAALLELYFALHDFLRTADRYDEHYVTQLTAAGSELEVELLCLDPSAFVDASLSTGRAAALFSATLAPPGYYRGILGCEEARAVALASPFPAGHLGLFCLPGISTRYRSREASIRPIADALAAFAGGRVGNYMAFFPSYAYLKQVYADFAARYPHIPTLVQESGLDDAGREAFLEKFAPEPTGTLLGFGVLGGVFGEGIDLAGDRLIGCAVVGVGLPQVNPRQEMLRRYFDEKNGSGFDYAYRFPGMNKVLQAAGRVIRTPQDRGVVLLIDDRFALDEYRRLFPPHWQHIRYLPSTGALQRALEEFWGKE